VAFAVAAALELLLARLAGRPYPTRDLEGRLGRMPDLGGGAARTPEEE